VDQRDGTPFPFKVSVEKSDVTETASKYGFQLSSTYREELDPFFFSVTKAREPSQAEFALFNEPLASELGLHSAQLRQEGARFLSGAESLPGVTPIAQAYCGHQFGHFAVLGDGRALLLGEHITPQGERFDIALKGSGPTAYSRRGDGLAALGPMLREFLVSEAMHFLGIPTTRSLAVVLTGDPVFRERVLPGAVLTRVASSHLRVGTFEYAAFVSEPEKAPLAVKALADYALRRHYPTSTEAEQPYLDLLSKVASRQAKLVAQWMAVGFVHGVMNTDNMSLCGETIDFGPCAFLDEFHLGKVFSSIDKHGRYAYGNQPSIALWNLTRLAEALLPLLGPTPEKAADAARQVLSQFQPEFETEWLGQMRRKVGLQKEEASDRTLIEDLFRRMESMGADFTQTFKSLRCDSPPQASELQSWHQAWQDRLAREGRSYDTIQRAMDSANPALIPRNHRVEEVIRAAEAGDFSLAERFWQALRNPFLRNEETTYWGAPPSESEKVLETFCGT
jgi:serine/tyrosine/threonine adenylyltransferase